MTPSQGSRLRAFLFAPPANERAAISDIALIASNCVPLFGVLVLHWQVFPIILLYWCENVVVGVFNVLKMAAAMPQTSAFWVLKVFLIPFFCFHYGMFTGVHGVFVFTLFGGTQVRHSGSWPTPAIVQAAIAQTGIGLAVAALAASHFVSFVWNYLLGGECRRVSPPELMAQPYSRVFVLHFTIIIGGILTQAMGAPVGALLVMIAVKTTIDLSAHRKERAKFGAASTTRVAGARAPSDQIA